MAFHQSPDRESDPGSGVSDGVKTVDIRGKNRDGLRYVIWFQLTGIPFHMFDKLTFRQSQALKRAWRIGVLPGKIQRLPK